jgi:ribosomal protein S12 methylthiotransferase
VPQRFYIETLGCPKNQVDSDKLVGTLLADGLEATDDPAHADLVVVNTCAFIEDARQESIDTILALDEQRRGDARLVVTGCMAERYGDELAAALAEADAVVGFGNEGAIGEVVLGGGKPTGVRDLLELPRPAPSAPWAYVKIAEGCDRVCTFCAIPGIRGRFQSRRLDSLVAEARGLAAAGVREINLVAQDSTSWGKDLPPVAGQGRQRLHDLVRALDGVDGLDWIRLLYVYPSAVTDELIDALAGAKRVLPYVDVPLQHASDRMLERMKRGSTADRQRRLVAKLRERIPGVTLRTTFIVGFPGETEADFAQLLEFVAESRFDRVGIFRYSDEEGTAALALDAKVPRGVARERYRRLAKLQAGIQAEKLGALVGSEASVLVDVAIGAGRARGRLAGQAPEIDGVVFLRGAGLAPGRLVPAVSGEELLPRRHRSCGLSSRMRFATPRSWPKSSGPPR